MGRGEGGEGRSIKILQDTFIFPFGLSVSPSPLLSRHSQLLLPTSPLFSRSAAACLHFLLLPCVLQSKQEISLVLFSGGKKAWRNMVFKLLIIIRLKLPLDWLLPFRTSGCLLFVVHADAAKRGEVR